jgi:hypothetical protein
MTGNRNSGRDAVSWLATGFVFFLGILFCGFVTLAFSNEPHKPVLIISAVLLGFAMMILGLREKPTGGENNPPRWFGGFRKRREKMSVKVARRHRRVKIVQFGTNTPPTVEQIRELKEVSDGMKNWVPPRTDTQSQTPQSGNVPRVLKSGIETASIDDEQTALSGGRGKFDAKPPPLEEDAQLGEAVDKVSQKAIRDLA